MNEASTRPGEPRRASEMEEVSRRRVSSVMGRGSKVGFGLEGEGECDMEGLGRWRRSREGMSVKRPRTAGSRDP